MNSPQPHGTPTTPTHPGWIHLERTDDGRRWLTVSKSWLGDFDLCPEKARIQMTDWQMSSSDASTFGIAAHTVFETTLQRLVQGWDAREAIQFGYDAGASQWEVKAKTVPLSPKLPSIQAGLDLLATVTNTWLFGVYPRIHPDRDLWSIEESRRVTVVNNDRWVVDLYGTPDLYDGRGTWDWKTGQVVPFWKNDRYDVQTTIYDWLVDPDNRGTGQTYLAYVPRERAHAFEVQAISRTPAHRAALLDQLEAITELIDADLTRWPLRPADWWCSEKWCIPFRQGECRGKHLSIYPELREPTPVEIMRRP